MKNALDCYYDHKLDKFILLEDIKYKNNRDINLLIEELRQYANLKNEQDINGEYEPPMELSQEEAKDIYNCIANLQQELNEYKFPNCKTKDIEVVRANLVDMMRKNKRLEQEKEELKKPNYYEKGLIGSIKERDEEISRLRKGIYKILKLNNYMIHCESKEVIYKFLMKQWKTIYETLGIPEPGLARCSKNDLESKGE